MSSTRTAKDKSVFHQSRFASSVEFERGLVANLVAKRCALLDDKADRELLWFIQYLSHQDGGMAALAKDLIAQFPGQIQTRAMLALGVKPGKTLNAEQVKKIRQKMPPEVARDFPLRGEVYRRALGLCKASELKGAFSTDDPGAAPVTYRLGHFTDECSLQATGNLENFLRELCLNPAVSLKDGQPWYFPNLINCLRSYKAEFIEAHSAGVVTALGAKLHQILDFTFYSRGLTLTEGNARLGKSHAAKSWCECNPGKSRFVEVPPFNDEAGFFRALARGLGLGNFLSYKPSQIRERVESVLLTGDLLLVLDEAQRLWPLHDLRRGFPSRIVWVMTMANAGVPICCVATPQFISAQKALEKSGWNSAQLTGRIAHYEFLPVELSEADLIAVAKSVLPEAGAATLRALAVYARSSARYLAAIDSIATRARYIAMQSGRAETTTEDVRKAMQESIIPADTRLHRALTAGPKSKRLSPMAAALPQMPFTRAAADMDDVNAMPPRSLPEPVLEAPEDHRRNEFKAPLIEA